MSKSNPVEALPYTNDLDDVIQPGEPVIVVTKSTGTVGIYKGTYLGSRLPRPGNINPEDYRTVQVEVELVVEELRHKVTNELFDRKNIPVEWPNYPREHEFAKTYHPVRNYWPMVKLTPEERTEYDAAMKKYVEGRRVYDAAFQAYQDQHHYVKRIEKVKKNLQRNRIFPINQRSISVTGDTAVS